MRRRSRALATSDEPAIPSGLVEFLEDDLAAEFFSGVDKAATPAERAFTAGDLRRNLERTRPQSLVVQRDSDANRDVLSSRDSALSQFSCLALRTGSNLEPQFEPDYISRVFFVRLSRAWLVGPISPDNSTPGADMRIPSPCLSTCTRR